MVYCIYNTNISVTQAQLAIADVSVPRGRCSGVVVFMNSSTGVYDMHNQFLQERSVPLVIPGAVHPFALCESEAYDPQFDHSLWTHQCHFG